MQEEFGKDRVHLDQWVSFLDAHGQAFACIDGYLVGESCVLVWECKLTFTPEMAWHQMEKRYAPILRKLYDLPVVTLQVCNSLAFGHPLADTHRRTPRRLFESPEPGRFTHHWLGR